MYTLQTCKSKNNYCNTLETEERAPYNTLMHVSARCVKHLQLWMNGLIILPCAHCAEVKINLWDTSIVSFFIKNLHLEPLWNLSEYPCKMICLTNTTITLHWLWLSYGLIVVAPVTLATGMGDADLSQMTDINLLLTWILIFCRRSFLLNKWGVFYPDCCYQRPQIEFLLSFLR